MADVTGPISTLPGTFHPRPKGALCDRHPRVRAVACVQGETDSFGSELWNMCARCLAQDRKWARSPEARSGTCEWCNKEATDLRDARDYDEGMYGRVYRVCGACRKRVDDEARAELDRYDNDYDEPDHYDDDGWDECGMLANGQCTLAGSEWCDWDCPRNRPAGRAALDAASRPEGSEP